jgi:large subunit ribosomal protein L18
MSTMKELKLIRHARRKGRVKGAIRGSTERPRLAIFRSVKNIYAQIIDDTTGKTIAAASSVDKSVRTSMKHGGNVNAATEIGKAIAKKAIEKGVSLVAFDRAGYRYHGRVKALAEAAREAGLKF